MSHRFSALFASHCRPDRGLGDCVVGHPLARWPRAFAPRSNRPRCSTTTMLGRPPAVAWWPTCIPAPPGAADGRAHLHHVSMLAAAGIPLQTQPNVLPLSSHARLYKDQRLW